MLCKKPDSRLYSYPQSRSSYAAPTSTGLEMVKGAKVEAPILGLPDEILLQCMQHVAELDAASSQVLDCCNDFCPHNNVADTVYSEESDDTILSGRPETTPQINVKYAGIHALMLTCRTFHAMAVPLLYAAPLSSLNTINRRV